MSYYAAGRYTNTGVYNRSQVPMSRECAESILRRKTPGYTPFLLHQDDLATFDKMAEEALAKRRAEIGEFL